MRDDAALFAGVQRADPQAWAEFVDRFGPVVALAVRRAGVEPAECEDVVQATWVALLRHAPLLREPRSLPGWVLTTARREAWRRVERRRMRSDAELRAGGERAEAVTDEAGEDLGRVEAIAAVRDGLGRLGGRCGDLLRALFLEDPAPAYGELASRLGIPVGSIGPTRQRCLAKLAEILSRAGWGEIGTP